MNIGFVKVGNYHRGKYFGALKELEPLKAHLKYIGFRSRERDPGDSTVFFDAKTDHADWRMFYEGIATHRALKHGSTVKAHKVIFSLRERDYLAYCASGRDYRHIVRNVLSDFERRKGVKLSWIAVKHDQNSHPHCHVVIRAVSEPNQAGVSRRIYISREDIAELKKSFDLEVERHRQLEYERIRRQHWHRAEDVYLIRLFDDLGRAIEQKVREAERERQRAKERERKKER